MTSINYDELNLDELRQYVLTHREDINAFYAYIDRSKANGRMITIDLNDNHWEDNITTKIQQDRS
ncbi:MAG: hypothetical protein QNJ41_21265 [Xenococcaceae cyanobacterium MO_188.B32]|nr:hypothetical protein [Xenococcaceae cyanobacterium MO_188.B32]